MATSTITRPYHGKVMYLNAVRPMSDEERNRDFAYGITMMVLFLIIPLLGAGVAATTGNTSAGAAIVFTSLGLALALGLNTRRRILSEFFRVGDASPFTSLRNVTNRPQLDELVKRPSLVFKGAPDAGKLTFIYNWLLARHAIEERSVLEAYRLEGSDLTRWLEIGFELNTNYLVVPYDRPASVSDEIRLVSEMEQVEAGWLSALVRAVEEEERAYRAGQAGSSVADDGDAPAETNAAGTPIGELHNKGQALPR